jgi:hypothetical protein
MANIHARFQLPGWLARDFNAYYGVICVLESCEREEIELRFMVLNYDVIFSKSLTKVLR